MPLLHGFIGHELKKRATLVEVVNCFLQIQKGLPVFQGARKFTAAGERKSNVTLGDRVTPQNKKNEQSKETLLKHKASTCTLCQKGLLQGNSKEERDFNLLTKENARDVKNESMCQLIRIEDIRTEERRCSLGLKIIVITNVRGKVAKGKPGKFRLQTGFKPMNFAISVQCSFS